MAENLCQYGKYSCFGCCGHDFEGKERVLSDVFKNSRELIVVGNDKEVFRDRFDPKVIRASGICTHLTFLEGGKIGCALHPAQNSGKDFRDVYCDKSHLCKTFFRFKVWPKEKKEAFLRFVDSLGLDNYEYSLKMDSGEILDKFEEFFLSNQ